MSIFNRRLLPVAAMLLLSSNTIFAQAISPEQQEKVKALAAQDVSTYVSNQAYELPWAPILEANIAFKKRVWREIDVKEKGNKVFAARNSSLANILIDGSLNGKIKVYDAENDRFTKELTKEEAKTLNITAITKYQVKEDWIYLAKKDKMVVRIVGVAPVKEVTGPDGKVTEAPVFWVYYNDCRTYLSQQKAAHSSKNWDEVFEGRDFKSTIIKVSNPTGPVAYKK